MTVLAVDVVDHVEVVADNDSRHSATANSINSSHLPDWVQEGQELLSWGEELEVMEWKDDDGTYRKKHDWQGRDLVHDKDSPVRVLDYYVRYGPGITAQNDGDCTAEKTILCERGGVGTSLTGVAHFTHRAESHRGYCHGGSMCSLLDDVIGWVAFLVTGECRPWTGTLTETLLCEYCAVTKKAISLLKLC
jgi:hypothetical protein